MTKRIQWWGRIGGGAVGRIEKGGPRLFLVDSSYSGRVVLHSELPGQIPAYVANEQAAKTLAQKLLDEFVRSVS